MTAGGAPTRRTKIELPAATVRAFRATHRRRGVSGATLIYGWITQAARYAREGRYDMLPPQSSSPSTTAPQLAIDYTQSAVESALCTSLIRDAGSSVRAVVAACVQAYIDADGDPVAMVWPRRGRPLAA